MVTNPVVSVKTCSCYKANYMIAELAALPKSTTLQDPCEKSTSCCGCVFHAKSRQTKTDEANQKKTQTPCFSSWWFQLLWNIFVKHGSISQIWVKIKIFETTIQTVFVDHQYFKWINSDFWKIHGLTWPYVFRDYTWRVVAILRICVFASEDAIAAAMEMTTAFRDFRGHFQCRKQLSSCTLAARNPPKKRIGGSLATSWGSAIQQGSLEDGALKCHIFRYRILQRDSNCHISLQFPSIEKTIFFAVCWVKPMSKLSSHVFDITGVDFLKVTKQSMVVSGSPNRWDRWYIITQLAIYTTYIPIIGNIFIYHPIGNRQ